MGPVPRGRTLGSQTWRLPELGFRYGIQRSALPAITYRPGGVPGQVPHRWSRNRAGGRIQDQWPATATAWAASLRVTESWGLLLVSLGRNVTAVEATGFEPPPRDVDGFLGDSESVERR
jgi:hypothetical protein